MTEGKPPRDKKKQTFDVVLQGTLFPEEPAQTFRKAVQVVHSIAKGDMTLVQRKTMNTWIRNAIETQADKDGWYSMPESEYKRDIGYESRNNEHLKASIRELMGIVFDWDVLPKIGDGKGIGGSSPDWEASVLFPNTRKVNGLVQYKINDTLKDKILRPEVYAIVDQNIGRRFNSAAGLVLYEHCVRFVSIGRTTPIRWQLLRNILVGSGNQTYEEFKFFNIHVLKPSIAEVNRDSDIRITEVRGRIGRSVDTIQFLVEKVKEEDHWQPDSIEEMQQVGSIVAFGVPRSEARKIARTYGRDRIQRAVEYTNARLASKSGETIANVGAYFRSALKNEYASNAEAENAKKHKAATAAKKKVDDGLSPLEKDFQVKRMKDAESYFNELDTAVKRTLVDSYNAQQPTTALQVKQSKPKVAARSAFLSWLANMTWGPATDKDLLDFAKSRG